MNLVFHISEDGSKTVKTASLISVQSTEFFGMSFS